MFDFADDCLRRSVHDHAIVSFMSFADGVSEFSQSPVFFVVDVAKFFAYEGDEVFSDFLDF